MTSLVAADLFIIATNAPLSSGPLHTTLSHCFLRSEHDGWEGGGRLLQLLRITSGQRRPVELPGLMDQIQMLVEYFIYLYCISVSPLLIC